MEEEGTADSRLPATCAAWPPRGDLPMPALLSFNVPAQHECSVAVFHIHTTAQLTTEFEGVSLLDGDWEAVMLAVAELEIEADGVCGGCGERSNRGVGNEVSRTRVEVAGRPGD